MRCDTRTRAAGGVSSAPIEDALGATTLHLVTTTPKPSKEWPTKIATVTVGYLAGG